jgi:acyl carrier protein
VLAGLLGSEISGVAAVSIDWQQLQAAYQARGSCRLFDLVAGGSVVVDRPAPRNDIVERLRDAPASRRRGDLIAHLQATVGRILAFSPGRRPDPQQGFFDMGLDSLTAMELRTALQLTLNVSLPATLAFDYANITVLADHLLGQLAPEGQPSAQLAGAAEERPRPDRNAATRQDLAAMSDAEVEALLEAKLQAL